MKHKRSVVLFLQDILDSIVLIRQYMHGAVKTGLGHDPVRKDAVERRIEIIAEATKHIPAQLRATRPEIPWPAIMAMRNFINHEYFAVDDEHLWNVALHHLDPLETAVQAILEGTRTEDGGTL